MRTHTGSASNLQMEDALLLISGANHAESSQYRVGVHSGATMAPSLRFGASDRHSFIPQFLFMVSGMMSCIAALIAVLDLCNLMPS